MNKTERRKLTLLVSDAAAGDLRRKALDLGLVAERGPQVGQGSISQLLEAIGNGEIVLHRTRLQLAKDKD